MLKVQSAFFPEAGFESRRYNKFVENEAGPNVY